jgi:uncharacterized caspase-like protein
MVKRRHVDVIGDRFRDLEVQVERRHASPGKNVVAVIGIDRYARWQPLSNAVRDAQGALAAFEHLGFRPLCPPLLDAAATADAIRSLVSDGLAQLTTNDSLVLFFAGHGYTNVQTFEDGDSVKTGYIIPVDGDLPGQSMARWLRLDTWLSDVARLAARHILVLLDACYSGIAVGSLRRYRGASPVSESFDRLTRRRSRKVITSARRPAGARQRAPARTLAVHRVPAGRPNRWSRPVWRPDHRVADRPLLAEHGDRMARCCADPGLRRPRGRSQG